MPANKRVFLFVQHENRSGKTALKLIFLRTSEFDGQRPPATIAAKQTWLMPLLTLFATKPSAPKS